MLTVYTFAPAWGQADLSPFVVKLETYLRLAGIRYTARQGDVRKAPKRKLPYIDHDRLLLGDTTRVIAIRADGGDPIAVDVESAIRLADPAEGALPTNHRVRG